MEYGKRDRTIMLVACCLSAFITPLLSTMMNLSLLSIGDEFGVGSHAEAYVNTAFLLSSVIFMVPLARVGDIYGKRRTYMAGVAVVLVASVLASFSPSFPFLLGCRVLMGAGASAITTMSVSLISDVYPQERRGGAIGMQTMCVYIGLAAGPPLGGIMNDLLGWHSVFYLVVPLAVGSLLTMSMFHDEIAPCRGGSMDGRGTVLYAAAMLLTMGGVINLPDTGALVAMLVGFVFLAAFIWSQSAGDGEKLFNIRLFRNRVFTGSCVAAFLAYAASYSVSFFMALYLQSIGELTSTQAGLLMLIQPAIQAVGTPVFGHLSDGIGDKRILPTAGMAMVAVGVFMLMCYGLEVSFPLVIATMVVIGFGFSVFSAPNTSVIMSSVSREESSEASAMVSFMRQTGMMVSMGIAMLFISVIMGSADNLSPDTYGDFLQVMAWSFGVCFVMCVVGMVASVLRIKTVEGN